MSNSTDEIEELRERLERVEDDTLLIAKSISTMLCALQYDIWLGEFSGKELKSYIERWGKKVDATKKKIEDSKTVDRALDIGKKFEDELFAYIQATKVATADKAMEIAHSFIKKYSPVALPMKAEREGDVWLVDVDVGALTVKIAKVKVDAKTGDILSYEIPEKK